MIRKLSLKMDRFCFSVLKFEGLCKSSISNSGELTRHGESSFFFEDTDDQFVKSENVFVFFGFHEHIVEVLEEVEFFQKISEESFVL